MTYSTLQSGLTVCHCLLTLLLWLAALLQFACIRDWTVADSRAGNSFRWVLCAGLTGLAARFTFVLIDAGRLEVPFHSTFSMVLMALGIVGLALEQILTAPTRDGPNRRSTDWGELGAAELHHARGGKQ